ncbi:MAG: DUF4890 domain-containing protein [Bacteroidota bacterium]
MNKSIKILAVIAFVFTLSFAASAQRGGRSIDPEQMAEKETTQMVEKLSLDAQQTADVKAINLAYANKMKEAREANKGDRAAMKEVRKTINQARSTELKEILTAEQFQAYEEMQANRRKGKKKGRGSRR